MKSVPIVLGFFVLVIAVHSEEIIVDSHGRKIVLHDNNTWSVLRGENDIDSQTISLTAGEDLAGFVKSPTGAYALKYNYSTWQSVKPLSSDAEYAFLNVEKRIFSTVIYRSDVLSVEELVSATLAYVRTSDPKADFISIQDGEVNGTLGKICIVKMKAGEKDIRSMVFVASNAKGSIQYSFVCLSELFDLGKSEILTEKAGLIF